MFDFIAFYKEQIEFYKKQIEFDTEMIESANRTLQLTRKDDRDVVEYVWGKGVVTAAEMRLFAPGYIGIDTRRELNERERYYRSRRKNRKELEKCTRKLRELQGA